MALVVYSNGIVEELLPMESTFSDDELVSSFENYESIGSYRLAEIPNTWCIWGNIETAPDNEFNKLASEIIDEDIYSHLIFIHDSELNPKWKLTDDVLFNPYSKFLREVGEYIKNMVSFISAEAEKQYEHEDTTSMIFLRVMGHTKDKRVLYVFNPNEQNDEFYNDGWDKFSQKIYEYLQDNFDKEPIEENKPFVIYSDTKVIVIVEDQHVNDVIGHILEHFEKKENYEACSYISDVREKWYQRKTIPKDVMDPSTGNKKKRRGRPPKNKNNNDDKKAED